jgi:uncharacterized protein
MAAFGLLGGGGIGMKRLRALLVAASLMTAGAASVFAQGAAPPPPSPEALQAAKGLVALMSPAMITQLTENMTRLIWPSIAGMMRAQYPNIDAATLAELRQKYESMAADAVTQAMTEVTPIYARYFTADEMNQIAAFYKTPAGAKALTVMPKVMADVGPAVVPRMQALKAEIGPAFAEILKKHGLEPK